MYLTIFLTLCLIKNWLDIDLHIFFENSSNLENFKGRVLAIPSVKKAETTTPVHQAGFRIHRSCTEQAMALTTHIEAVFQRQLKTGVVFVDLSAAYDTVWRDGEVYEDRLLCENI
jgi:hypothetical protein